MKKDPTSQETNFLLLKYIAFASTIIATILMNIFFAIRFPGDLIVDGSVFFGSLIIVAIVSFRFLKKIHP